MERQYLGAVMFIFAGFISLGVAVVSPHRVVWIPLAIIFLWLGAARLRRARRA